MKWKEAILEYPGLERLNDWNHSWRDLVKNGTTPFEPLVLHKGLLKWIGAVDLPKDGKRILKPMKKGSCFTRCIKTKKPIKHYEIALQVFLQELNDSCYAQYTLIGNAENWDIVIVSNSKVTELIELKEWDSGDCPLYTLVEALKNLELSRYVANSGRYESKCFKPELVSILAPMQYYKNFEIDDMQRCAARKRLNAFIEACKRQFQIGISFKAIDLNKCDFDKMCFNANRVEDQQRLRDNNRERATVKNIILACPELLIGNWKLII